ncbi:MAG: hypothetical protein JWO38_69, partial [Gemmataceae bacterium]|nr:hypothetical protein [Gemmataceae bacterium]
MSSVYAKPITQAKARRPRLHMPLKTPPAVAAVVCAMHKTGRWEF